MNTAIIIAGILLAIALVYYILPRVVPDYSLEKGVKWAMFMGILGYLAFDFFMKEKYVYVGFFVGGMVFYTYLSWIARRKE